ncbi:hypothetical protein GJAV_G00199150 [Gymnothorax javanicus]|nr:hypothetical protein GJAV_G00199150 [Gymnothorax javanicus]
MGWKRSGRENTPLRRSARLRKLNPVPENTEEMDKDALEQQHEGDEELSATVATPQSIILSASNVGTPLGPNTQGQLDASDLMSPGYCTVVLNRLKLDEGDLGEIETEEQEKKEDEEKDSRRASRHATSRIPTFQSSSTRKRPTGQSMESGVQPPVRVESSSLPAQPIAKGSGSGSSKVTGRRETGLPLPLTRLPIGSSDALPHMTAASLESPVLSHKRSQSPSRTPSRAAESQHSGAPFVSSRLPIRGETESRISFLQSEPYREVTAQTESVSGSSLSSKEEQSELEEAELVVEEGAGSDSSTPALSAELRKPMHSVQKSEPSDEEEEEEDDEGGEGRVVPLEEGEETLESHEESESELEFEDKDPSPRVKGAKSQSFSEKARMEEGVEPSFDFGQEEAGLSSQNGASGADKAPTSRRQLLAPGNRSRRRVSKLEVSDTEVHSYQPTSRTVREAQPSSKSSWRCCPLFFFLSVMLLLIGGGLHLWRYGIPASVCGVLVQLELGWLQGLSGAQFPCNSDCSFILLESLPEDLVFKDGSPILPSISQAWTQLLSRAGSTVSIAAFYLTLRATDLGLTDPSDQQGQQVFDQLMQLQSRGVKLQIAVNDPQTSLLDTNELNETGAEVRKVNLQSVTGGIIHTKLWVVDNEHVYVGSANMDWRSLSQVKEVGVSVGNCSCLAQDVSRVFEVYWYIGSSEGGSLPPYWPARYSALSSSERPLNLKLNGVPARVYLSSAPPQLSGHGRTSDLSAILSVISDAHKFIFISVMDYEPFSDFTKPPRFWPVIDSALREAACARGVQVNLLVSCWPHSRASMFIFLQSLLILSKPPLSCNMQVKVFEVSSTAEQLKIPFARVNHAKYMVTDRVAYIGTSNWSENYFTQTAGVGLVVNQTGFEVGKDQQTVQSQLQEVFLRDWESKYAQVLSSEHVDRCHKRQ